jgi:hypothetical protein
VDEAKLNWKSSSISSAYQPNIRNSIGAFRESKPALDCEPRFRTVGNTVSNLETRSSIPSPIRAGKGPARLCPMLPRVYGARLLVSQS